MQLYSYSSFSFVDCKKPHDDDDCVVFAFSSHGSQQILKGGILASDIIYGKDTFVSVSTIANMLSETNCPGMANKPKLLFFQVGDVFCPLWHLLFTKLLCEL